jgi:hypothetical protein
MIRMLSGPGRTLQKRTGVSDASRWQYDVKTLEGGSDTWGQQLAAWRQEGWELPAVVRGKRAARDRRTAHLSFRGASAEPDPR